MNRIKLLLLTVVAAIAGANAQNATTPYSMYGYGVLGDRATSMQRQMGSVGYAMSSGRQINAMNPASYAAIDSLTFLFDIGADVTILNQKEGSVKERTTGGGLDYVTMQFPFSKHFGGSIGLVPVSSVGYAFGKDVSHGALQNQGSGGINQAYLGLAASYFGVSLGFNVSYNFGNIVNDFYTTPSTAGQTLTEHVLQVRDWDIVIGAQYSYRFSRTDKATIGATFSPKKSMHGKTWVTAQSWDPSALGSQPNTIDTVATGKIGGNYDSPMTIGAGISYSHDRNSRWMVEADVTFQQWSKAKFSPLYEDGNPKNMVFQGMNFNNRTRYAVGGEYVPKVRGNYLQTIAYRLGAYYANDYINVQGNKIKEYGVTCGFGFNTPADKSMVNLGFEWKRRKGSPNSLITENYFNITLGINFNEVWFYKSKIR